MKTRRQLLQENKELKKHNKHLQKIVDQVDDVLAVDWIEFENDDYRTALHRLIIYNINIHEYLSKKIEADILKEIL
jgi:hypothetical protein